MGGDNNSPQQFKLFMTGTEWLGQITHSTDGPLDLIMPQKEAEARVPLTRNHRDPHGAGTMDSLKSHGYDQSRAVNSPASIVIQDSPNGKYIRMVQSEGHHRVAAAAAIEKEGGGPIFIPTNYIDNSAAGRRARGPQSRTHITPKSSVMPPKTEDITKHLR